MRPFAARVGVGLGVGPTGVVEQDNTGQAVAIWLELTTKSGEPNFATPTHPAKGWERQIYGREGNEERRQR